MNGHCKWKLFGAADLNGIDTFGCFRLDWDVNMSCGTKEKKKRVESVQKGNLDLLWAFINACDEATVQMLHERLGQESLCPVHLTDSARRSSMFLNVSRLRTIASPRQKTPTVLTLAPFCILFTFCQKQGKKTRHVLPISKDTHLIHYFRLSHNHRSWRSTSDSEGFQCRRKIKLGHISLESRQGCTVITRSCKHIVFLA